MRTVKAQPIGWSSALIALGVCLLRSGNQVALKFGLTAFAPFWTAFSRMAVGVITVGVWAQLRDIPLLPHGGQWRSLVQLSLLFSVQMSLLHLGADYTSPAYAVVLMNANPVFANFVAHFVVPEDRLSGARIVGLAMAFGGVAVILLGRPEISLARRPTLGNALVLTSALLVGVRTVYTQRLVQSIEPVKAAFWQMLFSLPWFFAAAGIGGGGGQRTMNAAAVLGVLYQGAVVSGLGFTLWATLLRKHSPGALSVFSFTVPLFGVLLSAWLFSEALTARLILGFWTVTGGIALATQAGRKRVLAGEEGAL